VLAPPAPPVSSATAQAAIPPSFAAAAPAPAAAPPAAAPSGARRPSDQTGSGSRVLPPGSRPSFRSLHGRRPTGDELIASLFEAMHELQFSRDVIEGGDYLLALALEMIPSKAALLHFYDINRREYVVACVAGAGTERLLNRRFAESEPLFAAAMRKRRALVFADARSEEVTASTERFVVLGGAISVIVSPVAQGGRFLGILELLNPTDGVPFSEDEGNAIDYMSDQFGEFVASRGTQLDPDRIARSVPPAGLT
jgi:hypothetical protein